MRVTTVTDLGNLVREARREAGLTQGQLAQRAGASRLWINEVEAGHPGASFGMVLKLLAALNLSLDVAAAPRGTSRLDSLRRRRASEDPAPDPGHHR